VSEQKLLAEWFWTDRWTGSSAFALPIEARGVYREMLTQAWRRGAKLPNDHRAIQRLTGILADEWERCWPLIQGYWRQSGDFLVNDTQLEIYKRAVENVQSNHSKAVKAAKARWMRKHAQASTTSNARVEPKINQASPQAYAQALPDDKTLINVGGKQMLEHVLEHVPGQCPPSPSPSPSLILRSINVPSPKDCSHTTSTNGKKAAPSAHSKYSEKRKTGTARNLAVITRLVHDVLAKQRGRTDYASLKSDVKTLCAKSRIAYDAEVVGKAIDSAMAQRKLH
jgi:uncharacterized protein YdaU (DUF1376 family)